MKKDLKILILEDSEEDVGLVLRQLKKAEMKFVIEVVETKESFETAIKTFKPDVILSDHSLPSFNSMDALYVAKQCKADIPFILVTGTVSEEFAVLIIKEGADDYILKNNLTRLPTAITRAIKARKIEREKKETTRKLVTANIELSTFIYKSTHDLRSPLCSIMGLANIAQEDSKIENLHDYIKKINESANRLDNILLSLIDVMSIKNLKSSVKKIDFEKVIDNILTDYDFSGESNEPKVSVDITNHSPFFSDEKVLTTILRNVIDNAVNYRNTTSAISSISIVISGTEEGVKIEISDNGIGIDPTVKNKVFDMFYRGSENSKGAGLGLYLAKIGVEKLRGTSELKSKLGEGTTVTMLLPTLKPLVIEDLGLGKVYN